MQTSPAGRKAITQFEGCVLKTYKCSAGVLTIGVGHTSAAGSPAVVPGMTISAQEADAILERDLKKFEAIVNAAVKVSLTQGQFDALVSFTFNLGGGALQKSTLLRKLNAGDYEGAAEQFQVWNRAGGRVVKGLTTRRAAEAKMFRGG
jgi:lysozyme